MQDASISTLIALVALALPVSSLARIMDLELDGVSLALSSDGYWVALALVAMACFPQRLRRSSASDAAGAVRTPPRGDA